VPIINNSIERNFGGISYEIDIDFDSVFEDIKDEMKILKEDILNEKLNTNADNKNRRGDEEDEDEKKKRR